MTGFVIRGRSERTEPGTGILGLALPGRAMRDPKRVTPE
jgi:hypothetical protein